MACPLEITKGISMAEDVILTSVADRVATLVFNRPDKLNALSHDLIVGSIDFLNRCSLDQEIGAIVVTGAGRAFCAGGDVSMMAREGGAPETVEGRMGGSALGQERSWLRYNSPKVTIAAVNADAMGAGLGVV